MIIIIIIKVYKKKMNFHFLLNYNLCKLEKKIHNLGIELLTSIVKADVLPLG